jgi:HK97 gp10 family phage protein
VTDNIYVSGLKELQARIQLIKDTVGERTALKPVSASLRKCSVTLQNSVKEHLKARGHVLTGTLLNNIIVAKVRSQQPGMVEYIVTVRKNAKRYKDTAANRKTGKVGEKYHTFGPLFYARFSEFGTSHEPATPWMRPAFEETKDRLPEEFRDDLASRLGAL